MNKFCQFKVVLVYVFFVSSINFPHGQHVHQYIVVEAYKLLKLNLGYSIPALEEHIGEMGQSYQGDYAWQKPYLTTGAYREDEEDVIFNYDVIVIPGVNYALVSITHFWNADDGDLNKNIFPIKIGSLPAVNIGPYENAYDKFIKFADGGWTLWFPDIIECTNQSNGHNLVIAPIPELPPKRLGVSVSYNSLINFYKTSVLALEWNQYSSYSVFDVNTQQIIPAESVSEIAVNASVRDRIAWEVLGRMCHLLGDMSVPAHTHNDEHGTLADSYENWMAGNDNPYLFWNHQNAGEYINPINSDNDPLHYLIYLMHQQANHFGSNGPGDIGNGNNVIGGNPRSQEISFFNSIDPSSFGEPTTSSGPWSTPNLENIRDKTFPFAIRATAGLLYWFAQELGLTEAEDEEFASQNVIRNFELFQNYPNPFNPSTKIIWQSPVGSWQTLKVYDVLGSEVEILVDEFRDAGSYEVEFDTGNLASGVYLYRLQAANYVETKKMILSK